MSLIGEVYAHVSNSGVKVSVEDDGRGPALKIQTSAFGNLQSELTVLTDRQTLQAIGDMLIRASKADFTEEYCNKASCEKGPNTGASNYDSDEQLPSR